MAEYIEREAAFDAVFGQFCASSDETEAALNAAIEEIRVIPAADVRSVVRGKWIWDDEGYHCSECWFHACGNTLECMDGTYRFCPSCGAEMEGE